MRAQDGPDEPPVEIDFTPPWPRISMCSSLEKKLGVTFPKELDSEEARIFFIELVRYTRAFQHDGEGKKSTEAQKSRPLSRSCV